MDDWCKDLWGKVCSPSVKSGERKRKREEEWVGKLEEVDGKTGRKVKKARVEDVERPKVKAMKSLTNVLSGSSSSFADDTMGEQDFGIRAALEDPKTPQRAKLLSYPTPAKSSPVVLDGDNSKPPLKPRAPSAKVTVTPARSRPGSEEGPQVQGSRSVLPSISQSLHRHSTAIAPVSQSPAYLSPSRCSTMHQFLEKAVVWLARPSNAPRPLWRVPSHEIIPRGQQVHTLESLFAACGWNSSIDSSAERDDQMPVVSGCDWAHRGVVFVDDSVSGQDGMCDWKIYPLGRMLERKKAMLDLDGGISTSGPTRAKPIWVFSMRVLSRENIAKASMDIESQALCRL